VTAKSAGLFTTTPCSSNPGPIALHFDALVNLGLRGAPGLSLASGKYDTYVMTESSSTFGLVISSGVMTCGTPNQSSARFIASVALSRALAGSRSSQSGKRPGADDSTKLAIAIPSFQSLLKFLTGTSGGNLLFTHPIRACFGVTLLASSSSSSIIGKEIWYFKISVHIKPKINLRLPFKISLASIFTSLIFSSSMNFRAIAIFSSFCGRNDGFLLKRLIFLCDST